MKNRIIIAALCLFASGTLSAQSVYPGQHRGKIEKETVAPLQVKSFDLKDIRLLPSRFRENMMRDSAWMASIDVNRLLHSFRTNAGVFAGREGGYMTVKKLGGWESLDCELRGHTAGHLLSAYGLMYAATGSEIFKLKGDSIVNGLASVQEALGNGYLSAFPEELINRNIRGTGVWAPWYTLHKLFSGLIDQYLYADNEQALNMVKRMGDWAYHKLKPQSEETRRKMIRNEFGGINESFYNLYAITGDDNYRWLAEYFYHNDVIDPLKELRDDLGTKHTNTFIPKVIAEARNYELTQNEVSRKLADFFWHTMIDHHTFAPGCSSQKEHFFDTAHFSKFLNGYTGETCCTYNMLKLSRHLFCWTGDVKVADYYERALYNHILGQQDPESGMVCYFLPLLNGAHKVYSTKDNSFWCCVGSGFESHAKYGEAIYYHNDKGIYVNLFIPSEVNWKEKGMVLRQETAFPSEEKTSLTITVEEPLQTTIYLRYPSWSGRATVSINGQKVAVKQKPGSYIALTRQWKNGDCVEVTYPMQVHIETTPDNPNKGALLYGPVVLAGERGTENMKTPASTTSEGLPSNTIGAIKKDSSGFIWLGTGAGLCRFDGCEIKTYPVLAGDDIWSIEELDTDTLLIGTVSGFKYFSRKTNEVFVLDIPSTIVKAIKKIDDRRFLAGTEAGLFLVDKHTPRQILLDSGLSPCNHITSIIREDKDVYWFSTADGLGRIDVRTMKPVIYRMKDALSNTNFFICLTRIGNQIYLGSFNKGVFRFDMSDHYCPVKVDK